MKKINYVVLLLLVGLLTTGCSFFGSKESKKKTDIQNTSSTAKTPSSSDTLDKDSGFDSSMEATDEEIGTTESKSNSESKLEVIKTENGEFKLDIPADWKKADAKELSDNADIELKNTTDNVYYMVLSEKKADFKDFAAFKNSVDLSDLGDKKDETTQMIEYNNLKGERHMFVAEKEGVAVYYVYDLIEGKNYYMQCISWTLNTDRAANEQQMIQLMGSLSEI